MGIFDSFKKNKNIESDNGKNELYYDNGQLKVEGNKKDGKENGYWKSYYENGQLEMEGNMQDDLKVGSWKFYYENGYLRAETTLDNNEEKHGKVREWHENGSILRDHNFKHGVPDGVMLEYFENGNIRQEYNLNDGDKHGENNQFFENGNKDIISNWKHGKEHGLTEQYYPSGDLERRGSHVDGLMEGAYIYLKEDGEVIEEKIMQKGFDITMELVDLMLENNAEHMIKAGLIKDGGGSTDALATGLFLAAQEFELGQMYQKMYDYYKNNNLRIDTVHDVNSFDKKNIEVNKTNINKRSIVQESVENDNGYNASYDEKGRIKQEFYLKNGKFHGTIKYYDEGLLNIETDFVKGEPTGSFRKFHKNGGLFHSAKAINDDTGIDTLEQRWYENGELEEEKTGIDGKAHGKYTYFEDNGQLICEKTYKHGKEDGILKLYDKDEGYLFCESNYIMGIKVGIYHIYSKDGVLIQETQCQNDCFHGPFRTLTGKGNSRLAEGNMINGNLDGILKIFGPNKELEGEFIYKEGDLVEEIYYSGGEAMKAGLSDELYSMFIDQVVNAHIPYFENNT